MIYRFILPFFALFFAQLGQAQVLATVGETKITLEEFKQKYADIRKQAINVPEPEVFLEDLIRFEVGVQEAEKRNLRNDPIVKERFRQELYKALLEKSIGEKVSSNKVTETEMRNYYQKNPEMRLSHILIEFKVNATDSEKGIARQRASEILGEVRKSKRPFEDLVKLYSDDTLSKNTGGDVGYHSRVTISPLVYDVAQKMKVGDTSGLIETQYGFHIIKLTGRRAYAEANKRQIRAAVFDDKRKDVFDAFFKDLKSKYKIQTNKGLLSSVK